MFSLFIGESSRRTVSTDKTLFIFKAGLTPQDVSGINNYPRSYSLNDPHTLFQDILPFGSSNKNISLWMQYLSSYLSFLLHQMTPSFMPKTLLTGQICNGPCVSVFFEHPEHLSWSARHRKDKITVDGGKKLASLSLIQWRCYLVPITFVLFMIGQDVVFFFLFFTRIPKCKLNLNRAVTGRSRLTVIARDSLFCLSKKISQK